MPLAPGRRANASAADVIDPVLRCPGLADHQDPVTTSHLFSGQPESVAKDRTAPVEEEEFMMSNNVERFGEHVAAAFLGQVTR
jgi:hypothetical protein